MNFYGASAYQDPTMAMLNAQTRSMTNMLSNPGMNSSMTPGIMPQQFGSYGMNPLMPGTSLLNQSQPFGINNNLGFSSNQNMFAQQPNLQNLDRSCDIGKAVRGFGKGLIINPLQNMLGTPQKAAMTVGTIGLAAAACACPLTAPVAIPVCAGLAIWGGIQGAIKFVTGAGKAADAASKGDGQSFEKAFEDVGEGTFNIAGAALAAKGIKNSTKNGPLATIKNSWNDGISSIKNFKLPNFKNWMNTSTTTTAPKTLIQNATEVGQNAWGASKNALNSFGQKVRSIGENWSNYGEAFNLNTKVMSSLNTDPETAQKQMMEDIKGQVAQGAINPAMLPPELQQQLGLANDPVLKQYLNTNM